MKGLKKFMALFTVPALLFVAAACDFGGGTGDGGTGGGTGDGGYKDVIERPDIEMPATPPQAVYPEKPAEKPSAPSGGAAAISSYTAFKAESTYKIEGTSPVHISYQDVTNFAYVYAAVENYSPAYGNVKITLNCSGAERLAIQAVYYEAYDLGYAPVTVHLQELTEGEQYAIFEMGESLITDKNYTAVQGQSVKDKTILGFVIFIDSLPSYAPVTDASGALDIVNFEFLPDGDPALEDRYVKPIADLSEATADSGVTLTKGEGKLTASGSGSLYIPVEKYSADYAKLQVALNGTAGAKAEIAVQYTLPGAASAVSKATQVTLTGGDESFEYDYENVMPDSDNDDLKTQYVKNGTVTAVVVTLTGGDELGIEGVTFIRTAKTEAFVSDNWVSNSSDITIPRAANGGNAKLEMMFNESWLNISVGVKNGANVTGMQIKVYAPDGLTHLGIGIVNNATSHSEGQNPGQFILRGSATLFDGSDSVLSGPNGVLGGENLEGIVETISYDEAAKIYTIGYDFSKMHLTDNSKFEDYTITSLIFYPHCPDPCAQKAQHQYDGTRALYFLSIDLITK